MKVMIDSFFYKTKPIAKKALVKERDILLEKGLVDEANKLLIPKFCPYTQITNRVKLKDLALEEIFNKLLAGYAVRPACYEGSREVKDFVSQQLLFIDVDKKSHTIAKSLEICKEYGLDPAFIYKSYNYSKNHEKHRIVFVVDEPLTNSDEVKVIVEVLHRTFKADKTTINLPRVFLGTVKGAHLTSLKSRVTRKQLLELCKKCATFEQMEMGLDGIMTGLEHGQNGAFQQGDINKYIYNNKYNLRPRTEITSSKVPLGIGMTMFEGGQLLEKLHTFEQHIENMHERNYISFKELICEFNKFDLTSIFGSESFSCIFHEDRNPSASIGRNGDSTFYKCFSEKCDIVLHPIDIYCSMMNIERHKAAKYLIKTFGFRIITPELREACERSYNSVNNMLIDINDNSKKAKVKAKYPLLFKHLRQGKTTQVTNAVKDFKQYCLNKCVMINDAGEHIFYMPIRTISNLAQAGKTTVDRVITLLTYCELLEKIPDSEVPAKYLIAKQEDRYTVQYYKMPIWTVEKKQRAEILLEDWDRRRIRRDSVTTKGMDNAGMGKKVKPKSTGKQQTLFDKKSYQVMDQWVRLQLRKGIFLDKKYKEKAKANRIPISTALAIQQKIITKRNLKSVVITKKILAQYKINGAKPKQLAFIEMS